MQLLLLSASTMFVYNVSLRLSLIRGRDVVGSSDQQAAPPSAAASHSTTEAINHQQQ